MISRERLLRRRGPCLAAAVAGSFFLVAGRADAQQATFHLDRLEMPGAPDDGLALFRPVTPRGTRLYAQIGLGYSDSPLRTKNVTSDPGVLLRSNDSVINAQFTQYTSLGVQFLDRFTIGLTLPVTWGQGGQNPNYGSGSINGNGGAGDTVNTSGPAVADMRLDFRGTIIRSDDKKAALGAQLSIFAPTGTGSHNNFGGDGAATMMLLVNGEYRWRFLTFVGNLAVHLRPKASLNDPKNGNGLGIGDEIRAGVGAFIPFKRGKYRLGVSIFGQTGIQNNDIIGNTFFTSQNTPFEWNVEGRMKFGPRNAWWTALGFSSFVAQGYGAPDFRVVGLIGTSIPILDGSATSPDPRELRREQWKNDRLKAADTDKDGIPDDEDACPEEPEDNKLPDTTDGCPAPPDRDGDGIPDMYDKCPDRPEDKDGIEDGDGCPEDDYDMDGVPDTVDACPKEPGKPSSDPKKNGCAQFIKFTDDRIMILEQVRFKTGSATILPDSFPMLQEIADTLKANQNVTHVSIEGHTDNRGAPAMNLKLSQQRADAVKQWLVDKGIVDSRLEAHGYGQDQPIDTNSTEKGRTSNRRVEFKVTMEDNNKPLTPAPKPKPQKKEEESPDTDVELD